MPIQIDPVKEAARMARTFHQLSKAVDDFRLDHFDQLTPTKRKQLKDQATALEMRAQQYTADALAAILTQITPHLDRIKLSTQQAVEALSKLNDIAKALSIADAAVNLVVSIATGDVTAIGTNVQHLITVVQ